MGVDFTILRAFGYIVRCKDVEKWERQYKPPIAVNKTKTTAIPTTTSTKTITTTTSVTKPTATATTKAAANSAVTDSTAKEEIKETAEPMEEETTNNNNNSEGEEEESLYELLEELDRIGFARQDCYGDRDDEACVFIYLKHEDDTLFSGKMGRGGGMILGGGRTYTCMALNYPREATEKESREQIQLDNLLCRMKFPRVQAFHKFLRENQFKKAPQIKDYFDDGTVTAFNEWIFTFFS